MAPTIAALLAEADQARADGRGPDAARLYDEAAVTARAQDDHESWARAVLGAASVQVFGPEPGRLPSLLYDVLVRTTADALRARLAAALARCWVYAGETARAIPFADEAVARARRTGEPAVLADALDAALATRWGPDDLEARHALTRELDEVAAHVVDTEARQQAHLWGLQVACELLDVPGMHRQMRALERLGETDARARFFAASRRQMLDLLRGRTDTHPQLRAVAEQAAEEAHIPDAWMVLGAMDAYWGIQAGERAVVAEVAGYAEPFVVREGIAAVCAEAAYWWAAAGEPDRSRALLRTLHGTVLDGLPHDVNWLLAMQSTLEAALIVEDREVVEQVTALLLPYDGRAVVNGGAVAFHGSTDDTLARALGLLGREDEAGPLRERALRTYERIGAQWWRDRLLAGSPAVPAAPVAGGRRMHLAPAAGGLWLVGGAATPVAGLRGFGYLRALVRAPGDQVRALDLVGDGGPVVEESGLGEVADRRALAAYRARLAELDEELDEAAAWADSAREERARAERDALLDEIGRATGVGGRTRVTGSSQERARVAVKKAISTAVRRIAEVDPALAAHLRNSVRTGLVCSYEPEPGTAWEWELGS
ncbi:MAG: hypothetical protein J7518_21850 [Nocardioidaceae bacterium]|nr:hypothetical protein [Nocardioidaceae bacterium]